MQHHDRAGALLRIFYRGGGYAYGDLVAVLSLDPVNLVFFSLGAALYR